MEKYCYSDGGRVEAGFTNETNDCAVRAYSLFKGVAYAEAHKIFADLGRRPRRGTSNLAIAELLGKDKQQFPRCTVGTLRRKYPVGKLYVLIRGHAFTIDNGVIFDTFEVKDTRRVKCFWRQPNGEGAAVEQHVPVSRTQVLNKKETAKKLYDALLGKGSNHWIAKQIAEQMGITVANAQYYVLRVFSKR